VIGVEDELAGIAPPGKHRRVRVVEDSGAGNAPSGGIIRFCLLPEGNGSTVIAHLASHPTLSMESFGGYPLGSRSTPPSTKRLGLELGSEPPPATYVVLDGEGPVKDGETVDIVGGTFALGALAEGQVLRAKWGGAVRSREAAELLSDRQMTLPARATMETTRQRAP
jgi:hypothetical protein